ncbi:hypothetical protein T439DRAFT_21249 [Meredithblackwellia eburnea MCA 4105]
MVSPSPSSSLKRSLTLPSNATPLARPEQQARQKEQAGLRDALKDVVSIRPVEGRGPPRSDTQTSLDGEDIISAYADRSPSGSPTKERAAPFAPAGERSHSYKDRPDGQSQAATGSKVSSSSKRREGSSGKKSSSKAKGDVPFDVIDRLDISGLYGGGALMRHDGPFAAAAASRNKGPRAPMAAFDPANLAPPTAASSRPPRNNSNLSARAQATLAAMDSEGGNFNDGPYGAAGRPGLGGRRLSDSSITMGFPSGSALKGKGQQLIEIYGVRDNEAWEDFGTGKYTPGAGSHSSSRESIVPSGVSKEERMGRAQSIWDIEATLREGKPVGAAPPPVPVLPSEFTNNNGFNGGDKPKRSKSIAARFRAGRKNPNSPMDDPDDVDTGRDPVEDPAPQRKLPLSALRDENGRFTGAASAGGEVLGSKPPAQTSGNIRFDQGVTRPSPPRKDSYGPGPASPTLNKFSGGAPMAGSRSMSNEGAEGGGSQQLGRRPSVMQRLFNKKK